MFRGGVVENSLAVRCFLFGFWLSQKTQVGEVPRDFFTTAIPYDAVGRRLDVSGGRSGPRSIEAR
jgi:hypothetical protein